MIGLLLEDVTLNRDQQVTAQIRFKGGVPDPQPAVAAEIVAAMGHPRHGDRGD